MKIKEGFLLRQVAGTWVVLPLVQDTVNFDAVIRLNDSGALLWQRLEQGGHRQALVQTLTEQYNVSPEQAAKDVEEFLKILKEVGCLED